MTLSRTGNRARPLSQSWFSADLYKCQSGDLLLCASTSCSVGLGLQKQEAEGRPPWACGRSVHGRLESGRPHGRQWGQGQNVEDVCRLEYGSCAELAIDARGLRGCFPGICSHPPRFLAFWSRTLPAATSLLNTHLLYPSCSWHA
jgi:hypothetical protein